MDNIRFGPDEPKEIFYVGRQFLHATAVLDASIGEDKLGCIIPRVFNALHSAEALTKGIVGIITGDYPTGHGKLVRNAYNSVLLNFDGFPNCIRSFPSYINEKWYSNARYKDWRQFSGTPIGKFIAEAYFIARWAELKFDLSSATNEFWSAIEFYALDDIELITNNTDLLDALGVKYKPILESYYSNLSS